MAKKPQHTPLYRYAGTIKRNWDNIPEAAAKPVRDMFGFNQVTEEGAASAVQSFLNNSRKWRGDIAKDVKADLKRIIHVQ